MEGVGSGIIVPGQPEQMLVRPHLNGKKKLGMVSSQQWKEAQNRRIAFQTNLGQK
jgi:hypothetical protein